MLKTNSSNDIRSSSENIRYKYLTKIKLKNVFIIVKLTLTFQLKRMIFEGHLLEAIFGQPHVDLNSRTAIYNVLQ